MKKYNSCTRCQSQDLRLLVPDVGCLLSGVVAFARIRRFCRCLILLCLCLSLLNAGAQTAVDLNEGLRLEASNTSGSYVMKWFGHEGRTYFIQTSATLMPNAWGYVPMIESGTGAVIQWAFSSTAPYSFVRVVYSDVTFIGSASDADFDDDGLNNWTELNTHHTDPLSMDSDEDGLLDGWELAYGFNPLVAEIADTDTDQDGLTLRMESLLNTNPNVAAQNDGGALGLKIFSTLE